MYKTARIELAQAIGNKTLSVGDPKQLAQEVAAYLLLENRAPELNAIMRDVMQYRADHGFVEATIVSAHDLSPAQLHEAEKLLKHHYPTARSIHLSTRIDKTVIGGLRIELANEQLDMTIDSKLRRFKHLTGTGKEL